MKKEHSGMRNSEGILRRTFCHIPSISPAFENKLWEAGIQHWDQTTELSDKCTPTKQKLLSEYATRSARELEDRNVGFFSDGLPTGEHWRLFPEFREHIAYLDIETTGLSAGWDKVTTIALYDGRDIRWYVNGDNLEQFKKDIKDYKLLVTYNGKCFDVPFLCQYFKIKIDAAHIDLRYILSSLGYVGGLKGCERSLGIDRGELQDVDGFFAVLLWEEYRKKGNKKALETLLAYNIQDVMSLERLLVVAYNKKLKGTPFARSHQVGLPTQPAIPFSADNATIRQIRRRNGLF